MFKTLFQHTFRITVCSLPVITVLLAPSAETDAVSITQQAGSKWIRCIKAKLGKNVKVHEHISARYQYFINRFFVEGGNM